MENDNKKFHWGITMYKVISFLKPYRVAMGVALFLMLLELFVELGQPLIMAKIIDDGIMQKDLSVVLQWGGILIGMSFLAFLSGITNSFYAAHVSQSLGYDVRRGLFEKVQSFSFADFNRFPTSSLITRMTNDVQQIQNTMFMSLRIAMRAPLLVLGGIIMAFLVNVKLALIITIAIPLLLLFLSWVMKRGGELFQSVQEKLDGVNNVMRENLSGIRLIKAFLRRGHEAKRFTAATENLKDETVSVLRLMELTMPVLLLVMNLGIIGVLWFGSFEISAGNATVGEVVAIVNYATRITGAFSIISWIIMAFSRAKASSNRISKVLSTETDLSERDERELLPEQVDGKVEFRSVTFQYPGSSSPVLQNISIVAKPGETIAILGATGAGKSSLFQLIPRLYETTEGSILIDGIPIDLIKAEALRNLIGYVPQEALLFSGSVKDNIAWGKPEATIEEMIFAAESAQIHETIMKLPKQYDTVVGQKGVNLSGGQKQRISISRAILRKPKILLLDDSTSALDLKTEAKLLHALREYTCTTLIITQKISTAMEADKIILLEEGKILAEGKHDELLRSSSLYQQIFKSQFGEEELHHAQKAR
jgi:ATP-binding cassette subfamily B multidrug efflux pump